MCSMKTEAMKSRLITSTGTGPLSQQRHRLTHTHTVPSLAVTPTSAGVLVERMILLTSFGNEEGLSSLKEGLNGGGWGGQGRIAK